jgi:hypothetical protein
VDVVPEVEPVVVAPEVEPVVVAPPCPPAPTGIADLPPQAAIERRRAACVPIARAPGFIRASRRSPRAARVNPDALPGESSRGSCLAAGVQWVVDELDELARVVEADAEHAGAGELEEDDCRRIPSGGIGTRSRG